jgi:hypothetical protein
MAWTGLTWGEALMRYAVRRLLVLPLMLVLAAVIFVLLPVVGVVQAVVALGVVAGRRSRWRGLRLWVFAAIEDRPGEGRLEVPSGPALAVGAGAASGRGGQREPLHEMQHPAGQPGSQARYPGDDLPGRGQDDLRPALADRADDLPGGAFGVHREKRQAGPKGEPGEFLFGLPGEAGLHVRAGAHQPGTSAWSGSSASTRYPDGGPPRPGSASRPST